MDTKIAKFGDLGLYTFIAKKHTPSFTLDSLMAPSSHYEITLYLSRAEIVFIGMATALGLMMAVALIVFNIVWRSHKYV